MHPITIIGSGLAGYTVAREFRKLDKNSPLRIITTEAGHFYSKPMLSNALAQQKTPETLITIPMSQMAEQLQAEILTQTPIVELQPALHQVVGEQQRWSYSQLVLAWGAAPIRLPIAGAAADKILTINHLADYAHFRAALSQAKRVAILGAGLIGCEFANDLQQAGWAVTVIDLATQPLGRLVPKVVGQVLQHALQQLGVTWQFETTVTSIEPDNSGTSHFHLTTNHHQTIAADLVLSAVGLRPHTQLATAAGLTTDRGIAVNRFLQTSAEDIYALGDCAQVEGLVLPFVMPLMNAGRALAKTLAGQTTAVTYPAMPVVVKTPACPVVVSPPAMGLQGDWEIEGQGQNLRALFYTADRQLGGMVLTGSYVNDKQALTKLLPAVLP